MHSLPIEPLFYYCRHDIAAARRARLDHPNNRPMPSRLFVSDGATVYVFDAMSGSTRAGAILDQLTRHFNEAQPHDPPLRFVPVNNRYWQIERLGDHSPETIGQLLHLIASDTPDATARRGWIIEQWKRRQLDQPTNEEA